MAHMMGSLARGLPATTDDLRGPAFRTRHGQIPLEDLIPLGNGGYVLWDNGAYVEVFVHVMPGEWRTVESEGEYAVLPADVTAGYREVTGGHDWPGMGVGMRRVLTGIRCAAQEIAALLEADAGVPVAESLPRIEVALTADGGLPTSLEMDIIVMGDEDGGVPPELAARFPRTVAAVAAMF